MLVRNGSLAYENAVPSTFNSDACRNMMITVTVQLTSMSRCYYILYYILSFDGVQCYVEWNWPVTISFKNLIQSLLCHQV